jgi:hypothetical protein
MALRDGFIIPNSGTYGPDLQSQQPDQGDFLILGNSQTGVVVGCKVTLTGFTAAIGVGPHIVVLNGEIFSLSPSVAVAIAGKGALPRFDLVVVDATNGYSVLTGTPASNPVFPDVSDTVVILAAIYIPAAGGSTNPHIVDKRNLLTNVVVGVDEPVLMRNYDAAGDVVRFEIDGEGKFSWNDGDTLLERVSPGVLRITDELEVGIVTASDSMSINGYEVLTSRRISWGPLDDRPPTSEIGSIWVDTTLGNISVWRYDEEGDPVWDSLGPDGQRAGRVFLSFLSPDQVPEALPLLGQSLPVANAGNLPNIHPEWVSGGLITLPDARGMFFIGAGQISGEQPGFVNRTWGTRIDDKGTISSVLDIPNLPPHDHQFGSSSSATGASGGHSHDGFTSASGGHNHTVSNGGLHQHIATDIGHSHTWDYGYPICATLDGADTCIDNIFNDSSHSYHTRPGQYSRQSYANIVVNQAGSHTHGIVAVGDHSHPVSLSGSGAHTHALPAHSAVGQGVPLTFRPPSLSLYAYITI